MSAPEPVPDVEHPPVRTDVELLDQAAADVLGAAIQISDPWTKARILVTAAGLYQEYGRTAGIPALFEYETEGVARDGE